MVKKKKKVSQDTKNEKETTNKDQQESVSNLTTEELLTAEKEKNLRLFAEFENLRKRTAIEKLELFSSANKDIMTALLPVIDNFERSIQANNYTDEDGPVLIYKQLKSELEKKGLKEIDNPKGKSLDTNFHEAISKIPTSKKKEKGKIIDIVEKGYMLGEKVIRYTKVVIGN